MKTILYQPLFINPQAYFVFPQLYHIEKGDSYGFEFYNEYNECTTYSFGRVNNVEQFKDGITYQITNSYNGIVKLDYIVNGKDNAELYIGKLRPSERPAFIGCHGNILIFNRTLTEYELSWVKNNMMCSKPQEPDIDL